MKKLVFAGAALVALMSAPALAADMPVKAPVVKPVPLYNWTGFYVGLQGGGGWTMNTFSLIPGGDFDTLNSDHGGVVTGYGGFNIQVAQWLVLGAEVSGGWASIKMSQLDCPGLVALCNTEVKSLGAVRGRVGLAFDRVLGYIAGGWGFGSARYDRMLVPVAIPAIPGISQNLSGPTVAAGIEVALTDYIIMRSQWERFDFKNSYAAGVLDPAVPTQMKSTVNTFTLGLGVKFGGPVVVAKF
jgi:outer membrane immunogenic protein